jgi:pyrroloquinoline quinone (PQQ) biosynthesis protein C
MKLRRTVPQVARSTTADRPVLLLDIVEADPAALGNPALFDKISASLSLGAPDRCYSATEAAQIVEHQYEACLEYIYSHPAWARIRGAGDERFVRAYLWETRHYLAAAPFRMATGVGAGPRPARLLQLQARHVVEEADHDVFFENALAELGCDRELVRAARPAPATVEWVHLMRTVAETGPLAAAICSGLLEFTAGNRDSVVGWHEHLAASGQLGRASVDAIFEHVKTDLGLGHGANWRHALDAAVLVTATDLADILNDVTTVAEMIVRWIDALGRGPQGDLAGRVPELQAKAAPRRLGGESDGLPVWPAEIYDFVTHGADRGSTALRVSVAEAYAFSPGDHAELTGPAVTGSPESAAADLTSRLTTPAEVPPTGAGLEKLVRGWLNAVDGHRLWTEMTERPTYPLVYGWMVENHHYVAGIWQHCGAGVAACSDPRLRLELVHHLEEEFEHGEMFRKGIEQVRTRYANLPVTQMRPLPTTRALVGALRGLGQRDWKAYVLAVAFLQLTLGVDEAGVIQRHSKFYDTVTERLPAAGPLLAVMRKHDAEDGELGHADDVGTMLELLSKHHLDLDTIASAALIPQLTWSFLDGVREHYSSGDAGVLQRIGWHVKGAQ